MIIRMMEVMATTVVGRFLNLVKNISIKLTMRVNLTIKLFIIRLLIVFFLIGGLLIIRIKQAYEIVLIPFFFTLITKPQLLIYVHCTL